MSAGWWDDNVDMFIFPCVLCIFVKHAYANGLKQCTILLVGLERHKWEYVVFLVFCFNEHEMKELHMFLFQMSYLHL